MTDKTFTRAGISTLNGKTQFRFTNDLNRERVLVKNGHTNIQFFETGEAMTKAEAVEFLLAQGLVEDVPTKASPKTRRAKTPTRKDDERILAMLDAGELTLTDNDEFVEPKDERIQVAMTQLAREKPGASAAQLLAEVTATYREFGAFEPHF